MASIPNDLDKVPISRLKRSFDIFFSLFVIIISSPLFIIILLAIFIEHVLRGKFFVSLFYTEKRISQGQEFDFRKFNIFKSDVIKGLRQRGIFIFTKSLEHSDNSMTFVGNIIQKVYLDELPQMFNILKGDISAVGPRPVNIEVYKNNLEKGDRTKQVIKAGWTGPAQSSKGLSDHLSHYKLNTRYINYCLKNPSWKVVLLD
ncbi:sugar transferase, partial [bacterium]|nr:sugar transferase [bacterium]